MQLLFSIFKLLCKPLKSKLSGMKKLIILLTVLSVSFISCKKDKALPAVETTSFNLENATVIMSGKLSCSSEMETGSVKIYQQNSGEYVLGLEQMNLSAGNLVVYLSTSTTVSFSSIKICSVKNLSGNLYHTLPNDIDFTTFKYLIIQTELSEETIGSAELS